MKFKLKDVLSNPFRLTAKYPISAEKVEELKESIKTTEFWDNIVARERKDGKAEIAYGHHRLEALKSLFSGTHEISLIVRPLSDAKMVQMMARENSETYKTNVAVLIESIRAAVQAYGDGLITEKEWPAPSEDTNKNVLRYAPSFIAGARGAGPAPPSYTALTLGDFIGQVKKKGDRFEATKRVQIALDALELIEQKYLKDSELRDLNITQLEEIVRKRQWARDRDLEEQAEAEAKRKEKEAQAEVEKARKEAEEKRRAAEKEAREATEKAEREKQAADKAKREAEAAKKKDDQAAAKKAETEAAKKKADAEQAERERREAEKAKRDAEKEAEKKQKEAEKAKRDAEKEAEDVQRRKAEREAREKQQKEEIARKKLIEQIAFDIIKEGYRMLAKKFHPDAGGSSEQMANLGAARNWLNERIKDY